MTTDKPDGPQEEVPPEQAAFLTIERSPEFQRLRSAFRRFVFPMTAAFLAWYLLYVVCSAYARDFMKIKLFGEINVALVFGLLQFVSTFLIAWTYERYARGTLEPLAAAVDLDPVVAARAETETGTGAGTDTGAGAETETGTGTRHGESGGGGTTESSDGADDGDGASGPDDRKADGA